MIATTVSPGGLPFDRADYRADSHPVSTPSTVTSRRIPALTEVHSAANSSISLVSKMSSSTTTRSHAPLRMFSSNCWYTGLRFVRTAALRQVSMRMLALSKGRPLLDATWRHRASCSSMRFLLKERANRVMRFISRFQVECAAARFMCRYRALLRTFCSRGSPFGTKRRVLR